MPFNKDDLNKLSAALQEPAWVLDKRLEAWDYFEKLEIPHEKEEPWRYTNLAQLKFKLNSFSAAQPDPEPHFEYPQLELIKSEAKRAGYLVQRGTDSLVKQLEPAVAERGVIFTDLKTAILEHPDLVRRYLFSELDHQGHIFRALHSAFFGGGTFLYVPKGVALEVPLESQRWVAGENFAMFPHTLIVAEEGAQVAHFERLRSAADSGPALVDAAVEIIAAPGAHVTSVTLQELGSQVWHFQAKHATAGRDSVVKSLVVGLGARFSRQEASTVLKGPGGHAEMLGLYFAAAGQHFDFRTLQDHAAEHCTSDLLYKGALRDNAHTVYSGLIHVRPNGAETDAYQTNRNLVLSDHAKADSKPELEIENNDVRCSHAASVGQLNEEEIFYLVSRGIPRKEAERLIINGFFEEVTARIKQPELRDVLSSSIEAKLTA